MNKYNLNLTINSYKKILLITLPILFVINEIKAYNFSQVCSSGQTLYYNIISTTENKVEVTYQINLTYSIRPTGDLIIPEFVTNNNINYTVTSIGNNAFSGCSGLTSITIPNTVNSIGNESFSSCSGLTSFNIPNSVSSIGFRAFSNAFHLESIIIPNSVSSIGGGAFQYCVGLESIILSNSLTSLEDKLFYSCNNLLSITIPNSITNIGMSTFEGCSRFSEISIPISITNIGISAFTGCVGIITVNYNAKNCTSIYTNELTSPFYNLSNIKTVNIGDSVLTLPNYLFASCTRIREINTKAIFPPSIDATTFYNVSRNIPVYPPLASKEDYIFDPYWSEFFRIYAKDYVNNTIYLNKQMVSIMTIGSGYVLKQPVKSGESVSYLIQPDNNFKIASLSVNGENMLDSLDSNGYLNFKSLKENKTIVITPLNINTPNNIINSDDYSIRTWSINSNLFVESNNKMEQVELIDLTGHILQQNPIDSYSCVLKLANQNVNIIRVRFTSGEIKSLKVK